MKLTQRWIRFASSLKQKRGMVCELCKKKYHKKSEIVCHHIIPMKIIKHDVEMIFDEKNIQILCNECHSAVHGYTGTAKLIAEKQNIGGPMHSGASYVMQTLRKIERKIYG